MRNDFQYVQRVDVRVAQNKANIKAAKAIVTGAVISTLCLGFWKSTIALFPILIGLNHMQKKKQAGGAD